MKALFCQFFYDTIWQFVASGTTCIVQHTHFICMNWMAVFPMHLVSLMKVVTGNRLLWYNAACFWALRERYIVW